MYTSTKTISKFILHTETARPSSQSMNDSLLILNDLFQNYVSAILII